MLSVIKMFALLLAVIYLTFISLGLPDSLLGSAWPKMHLDLNAPVSYMGIVTMIISACTIISSLFSDRLTKKFSTKIVTLVSVFLTAIAILGFSFTRNFIVLCLLAVPYGLGAGAIDATLNNYVANHYSSKHMNWLHCFWGVGTIVSPYVMSYALSTEQSWPLGYRIISYVQLGITLILFLSLPLWNKGKSKEAEEIEEEQNTKVLSFKEKLKIKGLIYLLFTFLFYCSIESIFIQWTSTYLVNVKEFSNELAAAYASFFFIGMTLGRLVSGFISQKMKDKKMIIFGSMIIFIGIILLYLPIQNHTFTLIMLILIGFGCGPIYPAIIHATPIFFDKKESQGIIGLEMASAYIGSTFMPPLFGIISRQISFQILPYVISILFVLCMTFFILLLKKIEKKDKD